MVAKFGKNVSVKISDFHMAKKTTAGKFVSDKNEIQDFAFKWIAPEVCCTIISSSFSVWFVVEPFNKLSKLHTCRKKKIT